MQSGKVWQGCVVTIFTLVIVSSDKEFGGSSVQHLI